MKTQVIAALVLATGTVMAQQPDAAQYGAHGPNGFAARNGGNDAGMVAPNPFNGRGRRAGGFGPGYAGEEGVPFGPARGGPHGRRGFAGPRPENAVEGEAPQRPEYDGPNGRRGPGAGPRGGQFDAGRPQLPPDAERGFPQWNEDGSVPSFDGQARPPRRQQGPRGAAPAASTE